MSRQQQIPGTERAEHPEIAEAAEAWREVRKEKKAVNEREKQKRYELIALMGAHKVTRYKYTEPDSGEEVLLSLDDEPKVRAKKTGEAEPEVGEGLEAHDGEPSSDVPAGLIAQAERAQAENGVAETADGDVVVPDKAAPKKSRKKAKGK